MARPGKQQIALYLPKEIYDQIKANADVRYVKISQWIVQACILRLEAERKHGF